MKPFITPASVDGVVPTTSSSSDLAAFTTALTTLNSRLTSLQAAISNIGSGSSPSSVTVTASALPTGAATVTAVNAVTSAVDGLQSLLNNLSVDVQTLPADAARDSTIETVKVSVDSVKAAVEALPTTLDNLRVSSTPTEGGATEATLNKLLLEQAGTREALAGALAANPETGALNVQDLSLEKIFGSQRLLNDEDRLRVDPRSVDLQFSKGLNALGAVLQIPCAGYSCLTVQLANTWAGTISFEGSLDGATFLPIYGVNVGSVTPVNGNTTTNGIYRFAVAGLTRFQIRVFSYSSGSALAIARLSVQSSITSLPGDVYGSQTNALSQRATTTELNTYDTNVAAATQTQAQPLPVAQVAPALATAATASIPRPLMASLPQYFPRVRVEIAGSERLPAAQEKGTNRFLVANPEELRLLEEISYLLRCLNMQQAGAPLPNDFQIYQ